MESSIPATLNVFRCFLASKSLIIKHYCSLLLLHCFHTFFLPSMPALVFLNAVFPLCSFCFTAGPFLSLSFAPSEHLCFFLSPSLPESLTPSFLPFLPPSAPSSLSSVSPSAGGINRAHYKALINLWWQNQRKRICNAERSVEGREKGRKGEAWGIKKIRFR